MNKDNIIIVENGYNTSYISTLLVGLFYTSSMIYNNILESNPDNHNFIYLQEMIKLNFINPLRKNISITRNIINEIRNYSFLNGWINDEPEKILEQQSIIEYYLFIVKNMNQHHLGKEYIKLNLENNNNQTIKILLNKWLTTNDHIYQDIVPHFVTLYLNRFEDDKYDTKVDINEKIRLNHKNHKWIIHSVICYTNDNINSGHYYAILSHNNKWLMFDDLSIPSIREIDMSNKDLINKIKKECLLLIYKYY